MPQLQHTPMEYVPSSNCVTLTRYFYPPSERPDALLFRQLEAAEGLVSKIIVQPLQSHQREAVICLVSDIVAGLVNCPTVAFEKSFLVSALNKGQFQIAVAEFHIFCYVRGKVQTRAWEKRRAEQYLFSRGHLLFD